MPSTPRYIPRYTVEDYRQWEGHWQLIDGVAIAMTPSPFGRHEQIVTNLVYEFMSSIERHGCDCRVYAGLDWIVSNDTVVRPDVMIVCGRQPDRHQEGPPELAVEVLSPSTITQDQVTKRQLYYENHVPFYGIVDPATDSIELLEAGDSGYRTLSTSDPIELTLPSGCRLVLEKERMLR